MNTLRLVLYSCALAGLSLIGSAHGGSIANCVSPDGKYDASHVAGQDIPGTDGSYNYQLQFCNVATETACAGVGASFCQYTTATPPQLFHYISKWDGSGVWGPCTDTKNCPKGGFQVRFANGEKCGTGPVRSATFQIACSPGTTALAYTVVMASGNCIFTVVLPHESGCPGYSPPGGDGGPKSGLSGGSIFLIILIVAVPLYVIIGCIYKRQRMGTVGMAESCPNIDFWRTVPGLIGDGFKFTWAKLRGCCGGGGGGGTSTDGPYETIK